MSGHKIIIPTLDDALRRIEELERRISDFEIRAENSKAVQKSSTENITSGGRNRDVDRSVKSAKNDTKEYHTVSPTEDPKKLAEQVLNFPGPLKRKADEGIAGSREDVNKNRNNYDM